MTLYEEIVERMDEVVEHMGTLKDQKRIAVRIPLEMHSKIKANAAYKNITYGSYVLRALSKELALDKDRGL